MYNTRKRNINKNGSPDTNNNPKAQSTKTRRAMGYSTNKVNAELNAVKPSVNKLPSPSAPQKKVATRNDTKNLIVNSSKTLQVSVDSKINVVNKDKASSRKKPITRSNNNKKLVLNSSKTVQVSGRNKNILADNTDNKSPRNKPNSRSDGKNSVLNSSKTILVSGNNKNTLANNTNKTSPRKKPNSRSNSKNSELHNSKMIQESGSIKNTLATNTDSKNILANNTDNTSLQRKPNSRSNSKKSLLNSSEIIQVPESIKNTLTTNTDSKNTPANNLDKTPRKKPNPKSNNSKNSMLNSSKMIQVSGGNKITLENNINRTSPRKKLNSRRNISKKLMLNSSKIIQVLGSNKKTLELNKTGKNLDIYEFTFDPNEEPQPQKKKRKKVAVKKQPKVTKPKAGVIHKSTYDQNITKALSALKKAIKPSNHLEVDNISKIKEVCADINENRSKKNTDLNVSTISKKNLNDSHKSSAPCHNHPSIRIEDIAANIEPSMEHDDLNYSPVNSPLNPVQQPIEEQEGSVHDKDPLNLQEDLSFFDDIPVANSSMNTSVRHPLASPWRVEFGSLPIKWHSNTYVKANMTPAVESSFICSEDSNKKKHVYTNMVPEVDDPLLPISSTPNHKQPSIISFMKKMAEKKAQKKRGRSVSPTKATNTMFENVHTDKSITITNLVEINTPKKQSITCNNIVEKPSNNDEPLNFKDMCKDNKKSRKRKNNENACSRPTKSPRKQTNKDCTYFGFDESENQDQENMSPVKVKENHRERLRTRMRPVLQEINGPTRAIVPMVAKAKTATGLDTLNKVYLEMKSASDAPVFPEKRVESDITHLKDPSINEDSQSVHLFEDIELVHHLKPTRKSYGKAKKVTFGRTSTSDGETQDDNKAHDDFSYEDDFGDLTFEVPNIKEKKKTKKKKPKTIYNLMIKKEEKEADEWAAGFNSMCQEVEEFTLVVE